MFYYFYLYAKVKIKSYDYNIVYLFSIQAISTVTHLLQRADYHSLKGMLSKKELKRWQGNLELEWDDVARNNLGLDVKDVALIVPTRVLRKEKF